MSVYDEYSDVIDVDEYDEDLYPYTLDVEFDCD